jgi:hypothetical protein
VATYLAGGNTRRLRGALAPLLKAAPLSKGAVSRVVGTLKAELEAWRTRSVADVSVFGLYLDAIALRARSAGKVTSVPVLGVVAILTDGQKQLVALELCGGKSFEAWKGCLENPQNSTGSCNTTFLAYQPRRADGPTAHTFFQCVSLNHVGRSSPRALDVEDTGRQALLMPSVEGRIR